MIKRRIPRLILAWMLFICLIVPAMTQDDSGLAAVLEVTYTGVEIQREGTEQWFSLRPGAQMPLSAGDHIRTNQRGRAWVRIGDDTNILLLAKTDFVLDMLTDEDGVNFAATLSDGTLVQQSDASFATYALTLQNGIVTQAASYMEVRSEVIEADTIVVLEGEAVVTAGDDDFIVEAEQGIRLGETPDIAAVEAPYNGGRLVGVLDGCPGVVNIGLSQFDNAALRDVYSGSFSVGAGIRSSEAVTIVGSNPEGDWLRIQYAHDFGWLVAAAIETECTPAPVEDVNQPEDWFPISQPTDEELALLIPLYGDRSTDRYFIYQ